MKSKFIKSIFVIGIFVTGLFSISNEDNKSINNQNVEPSKFRVYGIIKNEYLGSLKNISDNHSLLVNADPNLSIFVTIKKNYLNKEDRLELSSIIAHKLLIVYSQKNSRLDLDTKIAIETQENRDNTISKTFTFKSNQTECFVKYKLSSSEQKPTLNDITDCNCLFSTGDPNKLDLATSELKGAFLGISINGKIFYYTKLLINNVSLRYYSSKTKKHTYIYQRYGDESHKNQVEEVLSRPYNSSNKLTVSINHNPREKPLILTEDEDGFKLSAVISHALLKIYSPKNKKSATTNIKIIANGKVQKTFEFKNQQTTCVATYHLKNDNSEPRLEDIIASNCILKDPSLKETIKEFDLSDKTSRMMLVHLKQKILISASGKVEFESRKIDSSTWPP